MYCYSLTFMITICFLFVVSGMEKRTDVMPIPSLTSEASKRLLNYMLLPRLRRWCHFCDLLCARQNRDFPSPAHAEMVQPMRRNRGFRYEFFASAFLVRRCLTWYYFYVHMMCRTLFSLRVEWMNSRYAISVAWVKCIIIMANILWKVIQSMPSYLLTLDILTYVSK